MSYIFYKDLITEIAIDLNYKQVVHLLSRDYSDESVIETVHNCNPFEIDFASNTKKRKSVSMNQLKNIGSGKS